MTGFMSMVDDQISDEGDPIKCVSENKNRIALMHQGVGKKQQRTSKAQPPEGCRNNDLLSAFRGIPLDKKAGGENQISKPADNLPKVPLDSEELSIEIHPVHVR